MNAQNSITMVARVASMSSPSATRSGLPKVELFLESATKDASLTFRAIVYGVLGENLPVTTGDWCVASGRLESARWDSGDGLMFVVRDIFRIEVNLPEPVANSEV